MNKINDGGSAFPYSALIPDNETRQMIGTIYADCRGMTLRDYFAAQVLYAVCRCEGIDYRGNDDKAESDGIFKRRDMMARACYDYADAMLKVRAE